MRRRGREPAPIVTGILPGCTIEPGIRFGEGHRTR